MPKVRDTAEVRALLREWAEDANDQFRAERAHEAYVPTQADAVGLWVLVDDENAAGPAPESARSTALGAPQAVG